MNPKPETVFDCVKDLISALEDCKKLPLKNRGKMIETITKNLFSYVKLKGWIDGSIELKQK